jgi:penicillin amidase
VGAVNFVAADAKEIDWYVHAKIPDRGDPSARPMPWRVQKSVDDPGSFWSGKYLSGDQIPHVRAPADGVLFTANTDPFGFTADGVVENDPFYYGAFYANGFRAHRIEEKMGELIGAGAKVDRAAMEELQRDIHSPMADTVVPLLEKALADIGVDPKLGQYVGRDDLKALGARLIAWDRRHARDQAEPVIFNALTWFAAKRALEPAVSSTLFAPIAEASPPFFIGQLRSVLANRFAAAQTFMPDGPSVLLIQALDDTAAWIEARFGAADAKFTMADVHGALFKTDFGGEYTTEPMSVDGGVDTINVSPAPFFDGKAPLQSFASTEMALYRMVVGFAEDGTPEATVNFARGTSGEPGTAHFADQDAAWTAATYAPLAFRRSDVDARTETREVIEGGK